MNATAEVRPVSSNSIEALYSAALEQGHTPLDDPREGLALALLYHAGWTYGELGMCFETSEQTINTTINALSAAERGELRASLDPDADVVARVVAESGGEAGE